MRRPRRDNNRLRGVSAIYRSGPRWRGNVRREEVPTPAAYRPAEDVEVDPDHGLWQFFYGKEKLLLTPEEDAQHGRAWIVEELRHKSWEDLHRLWWVCVKEQNRIATHRREKQNMGFQHGVEETAARLAEVRVMDEYAVLFLHRPPRASPREPTIGEQGRCRTRKGKIPMLTVLLRNVPGPEDDEGYQARAHGTVLLVGGCQDAGPVRPRGRPQRRRRRVQARRSLLHRDAHGIW